MHAERTEESERGSRLVRYGSQNTWQRFLRQKKKVADTLSSFPKPLFRICSQLVVGFHLLAYILVWCWRCRSLRRHHSVRCKICIFLCVIFHHNFGRLLISRGCGETAPLNFGVWTFTLTYLRNCVPFWQRWKFIAYKLSHHSRWQCSQCIPNSHGWLDVHEYAPLSKFSTQFSICRRIHA